MRLLENAGSDASGSNLWAMDKSFMIKETFSLVSYLILIIGKITWV